MEALRERVTKIMGKFPSETAVFTRPGKDAYGQPTRDMEQVGNAEVWRVPPPSPSATARDVHWTVTPAGTQYDDKGPFWVCTPWRADLPRVRNGDTCTLPDGVKRTVRNMMDRGNIRMFWQLSEV